MELVENNQVEQLLLEALKPYAGRNGRKALPEVRMYKQESGKDAFILHIVLRHEDFEVHHLDGRTSFSTFPVCHAHGRAYNCVRDHLRQIQRLAGASNVMVAYSADRPFVGKPSGSSLTISNSESQADDGFDDDCRAGWPSKNGNPSGGGRDNNPPRK